ncbi:hypothetical protein HMI54_008719 [Coelomomyces lativittatus]|nr:hypothetical protein HMI55_003243 [Coelomomyces lativittatus]KAJ1502741.1 hypothetical protein HMI54_008719 [Coelomomyces lativittatus]
MSVFLKDGLDRPIKLTHMLRLFPLDEDQLLQERIYQCVTKTAHKKSFIPLLMVEQMDEIVINEPTEAFYDFVLEKFKTDTYPLKGPVFNHKLEMQELDRLKKSQKQVNQLIEQYKWKLKEIEERSLSSQKAKTASYSSSTGSSPTIPTHHEVESQLDMKIK